MLKTGYMTDAVSSVFCELTSSNPMTTFKKYAYYPIFIDETTGDGDELLCSRSHTWAQSCVSVPLCCEVYKLDKKREKPNVFNCMKAITIINIYMSWLFCRLNY